MVNEGGRLVADVPSPLRPVAYLTPLDDIDHGVFGDVLVAVVGIFVVRSLVDLQPRTKPIDGIFKGPVTLRHQPDAGVSAEFVAVGFELFDQFSDGLHSIGPWWVVGGGWWLVRRNYVFRRSRGG